MLAWTYSKLDEHRQEKNNIFLVAVLRRYRAPSGPCCLVTLFAFLVLRSTCSRTKHPFSSPWRAEDLPVPERCKKMEGQA
jgi:hypothetical protein